MKHALATLIPLCVIGFLGFWISTLVLGKIPTGPVSTTELNDDFSISSDWELNHAVNNEEFTSEIAANPNLIIELSDATARIEPHNSDNIEVYVKNTSSRTLNVNLERDKDKSTKIKIGSSFRFGIFNFNFFEIFTTGSISDRQVVIKVPQKTFDSVKITQGSGKVNIIKLQAKAYDVDLGSGQIDFEREIDDTRPVFALDMGSGNAKFTGFRTSEYSVNIGSGNCRIDNLMGSGKLAMGSGSADISFDSSPEGKFDMGSGHAILTVPDNSDTKFDFDIGSGSIEVKGNASTQKYSKDSEYIMGTGSSRFNIDLGSGKVEIETKH